VFLAWVSEAWDAAGGEPAFLEEEAGAESGAGSVGVAHVAESGLAGGAGLGA